MAKDWDYNETKTGVLINPPKATLKISGHRLSSVLGLNKYQSPFGAWCEITKLVKLPFEDTKYTIAGKVLEPKIIKYVSERFPNVMSIEDYYGSSFDDYRYNNFKDDSDIFGGVIDAVSTKNDKKTIAMICECKTSSHPEQWANGNVPVEYMLQGALYSYLKGLDRVLFACTFLDDIDYGRPEDVEVTDKNTILVVKKLEDMIFEIDGQYLNIEGIMQRARDWWNAYVETGISPEFNEKLDKEYLDVIRATDATKDSDLEEVCRRSIALARDIDMLKEDVGINSMEKELKMLEASIKSKMIETNVTECSGYKLNRKVSTKFDEKSFAENEPTTYEKYCEEVESYTLTKNKKMEE